MKHRAIIPARRQGKSLAQAVFVTASMLRGEQCALAYKDRKTGKVRRDRIVDVNLDRKD